jgi:2-C-methyl-D-erythritol 4-phosphate cytidylyltransferase
LAQRVGRDVHVVEGSSSNFKITTADDWLRARQIWPAWAEENRA